MSLLSVIKVKLGQAADAAKNFIWDASAADGTLKLLRENGQQIMAVNALGEVDFPQMIRSLTGNGYLKLPSGLIIQWGTVPVSAGGELITYPITFPNARLHMSGSPNGISSSVGAGSVAFNAGTLSGCNVYYWGTSNFTARWFAIGY